MRYNVSDYLIDSDLNKNNIKFIYNALFLIIVAFFLLYSNSAFASDGSNITEAFTGIMCKIITLTNGSFVTIIAVGGIFYIGYKTVQGEMKIWAALPVIIGIIIVKMALPITQFLTGGTLVCP